MNSFRELLDTPTYLNPRLLRCISAPRNTALLSATYGFSGLDIWDFLNTILDPLSEIRVTNPSPPSILFTNHVLKTQSAFAHFSSPYGTQTKGYFKGVDLVTRECRSAGWIALFKGRLRKGCRYMSKIMRSWDKKGFMGGIKCIDCPTPP